MMLAGLLLSAATMAQGVSKLFGLVGGYPQNDNSSNGFLFSTDSSGQNFQLQYNFPVQIPGASPVYLEMVPYNGKLYGTTSQGGAFNTGTIFEYDPATNVYTKKFDFSSNVSTTGDNPRGGLLLYNNKFYGLTAGGGINYAGTLFEWDPATNVFTKKYDFTGSGGSLPQSTLRLMNGKMYGTTVGGGISGFGVVFEWNPVTNTYTDLFDLTGPGAGNGWSFYCSVTPYNNKLYCASYRGAANDAGALYVVDPSLPNGSNTTTIKVFDAASGSTCNNNEMIVYNNKLYGTLFYNGSLGQGTLFELNPATNTFTKLLDFNYTTMGGNPIGKLVVNGTKFLGICYAGGTNGQGIIYEWDPANPTTVVKKYDFPVSNTDNPIKPICSMVFLNSKFYGVTNIGGFNDQGTLYEFDYNTATLTKKLNFNTAENGRIPYGRPTLLNGKIYGTCNTGPQPNVGCIWEYDPSTTVYARKYNFDMNSTGNGSSPTSSPVAYNNKLYGTTGGGGTSGFGVFYEFDPATNGYVRKDFQPIGGQGPIGEPTLYNGKLYGITSAGGLGNWGIVYSYDPATATLSKLYDIQSSGSNRGSGSFTVYNNKLYGATSSGGANNYGGVIVFDPATNTASTVASFAAASGITVNNAPAVYNDKLYWNTYSGGGYSYGAILMLDPATNTLTNVSNYTAANNITGVTPKGGLTVSGSQLYGLSELYGEIYITQFDPATNTLIKKSTYIPASNYNMPVTGNGLTVVPAFIANGLPNSCQTFPSITIDATNNNKWVPILNAGGDVLAEIKANGNNLGVVSASVYINNGTVRENPYKQLYMDRNLTITTQNPVSSGTVDIRLYVKSAEFLALKNAVNSLGQPSGINTINDVSIFKNEQTCAAAIGPDAFKLTTTATPYEYGYVLSTSVSSFSTFFFASSALGVLPVRLLSFNATTCNNKQTCLTWAVENEQQLSHYQLEKSADGIHFEPLQSIPARNTGIRDNYNAKDFSPFAGDNYYRLKMVDMDGTFSYSPVERVNFGKPISVTVQPNPAYNMITLQGLNGYEAIQVRDMDGQLLMKARVTGATLQLDIRSLAKGAYTLQLMGQQQTDIVRFIKL